MPVLKRSNTGIVNLYKKTDKRNGRTYFQYKDPLSGRCLGFGSDEKLAVETAGILNVEAVELLNTTLHRLPLSRFITLNKFLPKYENVVNRRRDKKEIATSTAARYVSAAKKLATTYGKLPMSQINARNLADLLDVYIDEDKVSMASSLRASWIDLFKEALHSAEVPPGHNPAAATKKPQEKVQRQRLNLAEWQLIHENTPQHYRAVIMLALVSGQRRSDIVNMKFSDVWGDHLHVKQIKTGFMLAIPLALHCDAVGMTLGEVIESCRDGLNSDYLAHHHQRFGRVAPGSPIDKKLASRIFSNARNAAKIPTKPGKTPSTLHEVRSLAERLYREQGVDTKTLLGHTSQVTTDIYNDEREAKWAVLTLPVE